MKAVVYFLVFCLMLSWANAGYDYTHHDSGKELKETLINEPQAIFTVFLFKNSEDKDKNKKIADMRADIRQRLLGQDVRYTEVDMSDAKKADSYADVVKLLGIQPALLDQSPIIAVAYNRSGYWIHGDGAPKSAAETVQRFVGEQGEAAKKSTSAPVSFGGSSRSSSDKSVSVGGY